MIDISQHTNCICYKDKRNSVVCEENNSRYVLHNNSGFEIEKIKVDTCLPYMQNERKCDFLLRAIKSNDKRLYLIELKGKAVLKAVSQLDNSLSILEITGKSANQVNGRIVPTRVHPPDLRSTSYLKLKNRFKALNGDLNQKNSDTI